MGICSSRSSDLPDPSSAANVASPSPSGVQPVPGAANHDGSVTVSRPPEPTVATPVEISPQDRETTPPPESPPRSGETRMSPPSPYRGVGIRPSFSMDNSTTTNRQHQFGSSAGASTADGSARARPSVMATRSNSASPSSQLATPVSLPPQTGIRADKPSPRRAVTTDLSHYQLITRTYQTRKDVKKPQSLTSTVRELLPDNFRYEFGCHLISYNCHDCPQIQNFGCREGAFQYSSVAPTQINAVFRHREARASPHS
jgi:hypothetical protein